MKLSELVNKVQQEYNKLAEMGNEDESFDNFMSASLENIKSLSPNHLANIGAEALSANSEYFSDVLTEVPNISGLNLAEEVIFYYLMDNVRH